MKNNLFILHSLNGNTKNSFKDSVTEIAQSLDYNVIYPIFPTSKNASYESFKNIMNCHGGG